MTLQCLLIVSEVVIMAKNSETFLTVEIR